jgi:hypothetical protein
MSRLGWAQTTQHDLDDTKIVIHLMPSTQFATGDRRWRLSWGLSDWSGLTDSDLDRLWSMIEALALELPDWQGIARTDATGIRETAQEVTEHDAWAGRSEA